VTGNSHEKKEAQKEIGGNRVEGREGIISTKKKMDKKTAFQKKAKTEGRDNIGNGASNTLPSQERKRPGTTIKKINLQGKKTDGKGLERSVTKALKNET